ncbi:hypothetical protein K470DRAFT_203277, partial [Piedraia hortae CBS 480.64]
LLAILWVLTLTWGERRTFPSHINPCAWHNWETWPQDSKPHHILVISDPQLVDPHTYPGRPWPLSALTVAYTDRYMTRAFRGLNKNLDPDSVIFLGDLLDGGREWATEKIRMDGVAKRSVGSYRQALAAPHKERVRKEDHFLDEKGRDIKEFVHGEGGRWAKWGQRQWDRDYARLGNIFFSPEQMYPDADRKAVPYKEVVTKEFNVLNGAEMVSDMEYATFGRKQRRMLTSLPGNHDVGFGKGVQLAVRDRFLSRFGETNRVDVIGNHTFVSLDTPSLSAAGQFQLRGGESTTEDIEAGKHIWEPTMGFLEGLKGAVDGEVGRVVGEFYSRERRKFEHRVVGASRGGDGGGRRDATAPELPVVLLTHIPLYREPGTKCGPLRERGTSISISGGYQYQNVVTKTLSQTIVSKVAEAGDLVQVFSGDDHDYCDVRHSHNGKTFREITVKSFSWAMGVRVPAVQLLSLWNPVDEHGKTIGTPLPTIQTRMCLLPDQLGIFIVYAKVLGFTVVILLLRVAVVGFLETDTQEE